MIRVSKFLPIHIYFLKTCSWVWLLMPSEIFLSYLSPRPALSVALSTSLGKVSAWNCEGFWRGTHEC